MSTVMFDLETLSALPNAVILTLGAIKFDPFTLAEPTDELYLRIEVDKQIADGRDVSEQTMEWWAQQPVDIQEEAMSPENRVSVESAMQQFNKFLVGMDKIWCQGPHFDITITENFFRQYKTNMNWHFYQVMDSRTLFSVHGDPRDKSRKSAHNAVEDCKEQARAVQQTFKKLGITKYANRF